MSSGLGLVHENSSGYSSGNEEVEEKEEEEVWEDIDEEDEEEDKTALSSEAGGGGGIWNSHQQPNCNKPGPATGAASAATTTTTDSAIVVPVALEAVHYVKQKVHDKGSESGGAGGGSIIEKVEKEVGNAVPVSALIGGRGGGLIGSNSANSTSTSPVDEERMREYERLATLASDYCKKKKYVEAIKLYDEACALMHTNGDIAADPTTKSCYIACNSNLALCYLSLKKAKKAILFATKALAIDPTYEQALSIRGRCLYSLSLNSSHDWDNLSRRAFEDFKLGSKLYPNNKEMRKDLNILATFCLYSAVKNGEFAFMEDLLNSGADMNYRPGSAPCNYSAIIQASMFGHADIVQLLLSRGANIQDSFNEDGGSPLSQACMMICTDVEKISSVVKILLKGGADVHDKLSDGTSILMIAAQCSCAEIVDILISHGARIDERNENLHTPLILASWHGRVDVVEFLLSIGSNIDDKDIYGQSSIYMASKYSHLNIAKLLLQKCADIHSNDIDGLSPIMIACHNQMRLDPEMVKFLLSKGANANDMSNDGQSCIDLANHDSIVDILEKWPVTMAIILSQELRFYSGLYDSLGDLDDFVG